MPASDHKVTQLAFFFRSRALRVWNISIILAARSLGNLFRAFASISGCDPVWPAPIGWSGLNVSA